jgi:hypothetical protein
MREIRTSGSEGGGAETNRPSLPLSVPTGLRLRHNAKPVVTGCPAFAEHDTHEMHIFLACRLDLIRS